MKIFCTDIDLKGLSGQYQLVKNNGAWNELILFLKNELDRVKKECKFNDNPEARGQWQLIDKILEREKLITEEIDKLLNKEDNKNK